MRRIAQLAPPNTVTRSSNGSCRSLCVLRRAAASRLASRWRFSEPPPLRTSSAGESAVYAIETRRIRVHLGTLRNGARREARTKRANLLRNLEAPPGFEPGMEVLQTSALPLGDGAGWNQSERSGRVYTPRQQRSQETGRCVMVCCRSPYVYHVQPTRRSVDPSPEGRLAARPRVAARARMERETGFEPATSTLARSHSTTELFPPA